jgi:hypothetical protein
MGGKVYLPDSLVSQSRLFLTGTVDVPSPKRSFDVESCHLSFFAIGALLVEQGIVPSLGEIEDVEVRNDLH